MGESLTERRRVEDEGLRVVNSFCKGRNVRITLRVILKLKTKKEKAKVLELLRDDYLLKNNSRA